MPDDKIHPAFAQAVSAEDRADRIEGVRIAYSTLLATLERTCPPGRALAVAKTELETSCMWAIKSIAHAKELELPPLPAIDHKLS